MTERRPHWDDDLIEAVYSLLPYGADSEQVFPIIAAVEDWVLSAPIFDLYLSRKHAPDKAAIQRVRDVCESRNALTVWMGNGETREAVDRQAILRALDGERDE